MSDTVAQALEQRGDKALASLNDDETLVLVGHLIGLDDLVLGCTSDGLNDFFRGWRSLLLEQLERFSGVWFEMADDRFTIMFPRGGKLLDRPLHSAFGLATTLDREAAPLFDRAVQHLRRHPLIGGQPRLFGLALGLDLGVVRFSHFQGRLLAHGEPFVWARRAAQGPAGSVMVNNGLRWRLADRALEPASAVELYAFHILFEEEVITADGVPYRVYRLPRRKDVSVSVHVGES